MPEGTFSLTNRTKEIPPKIDFWAVKNSVLSKNYELSLAFVGNTISRKLNLTYRGKNKPTNVLSFPIEKNKGEIIIDLKKVKSELKIFNTTYKKHLLRLFIHGLLHLKGYEHGVTMENKEKMLCAKFLSK